MKNIFYLRNNYLEKIIFYLIVLLPITLISGPFLSDLSVTIITLFFLYISYKNKLYFYYKNIFSKIFFVFFIILLITSAFSLDPLISFKKTIVYFRFWIFALAVWYIFSKEKKIINYLVISFSIVFIILIIDGYIQFIFKENIFGWPMQGERLSSLFKDELILGSYLSRFMPIFFGFLIFTNFNKNNYKYMMFFLIFVGIETLTFLSGERVAFFFINAASIMLLLTMRNYKKFRGATLIISMIAIICLINLFPKSTDRIFNKTINQLGLDDEILALNKIDKNFTDIGANENKNYIFSVEYENHYISSFRMFKDNIITGIGPRMFRHTCVQKKYNLWEGCSTHPHNTYVQLLAETGIVGFIFGLGVFLTIFFLIIKHLIYKFIKNKIIFDDFQLCMLSAILISIWPFIPTGGLFNNWLNIIYFFPVGFLLNTIYSNKNLDKY